MKLLIKIFVLIVIKGVFLSSAFAQGSSACNQAIKSRYDGSFKDKYGNTSSSKVSHIQYYTTFRPGSHKYGNNNSLYYVAVVDKYKDGRMTGRDTYKLHCVVNQSGSVIGIERDFR
jgi:hypothetical protein